jgi:hypothetical protein
VFPIVALTIVVSFSGMPSSSIALYRCILITKSYATLKSTKRKCVSIFLYCAFSRICHRMNRALVVDLPGQKPYWYDPISASVCGCKRT